MTIYLFFVLLFFDFVLAFICCYCLGKKNNIFYNNSIACVNFLNFKYSCNKNDATFLSINN